MRSILVSVAIFGIGLLLCAACGAPASGRSEGTATNPPASAAQPSSSSPQADAPVSNSGGASRPGSDQTSGADSSVGGNTGSAGDDSISAGSPGSAGDPNSGVAGGADGSASKPGASPMPPAEWKTLRDTTLGFAISYPDVLTPNEAPGAQADALRSLHFFDSSRANQPGGNLPQFSIDVFNNSGKLSLDQWLDANAKDGMRQAMTIDNQQGYQVTLPIEIAPNQFYYVISGGRVYKLTPLGEYGQQMLQSFKLQP
jgi:hypothetical protein